MQSNMIGDYPTQLDEIDQWISDTFGILPGACSSTENLRYSVARRVAEALWPNNQSLSDANKRLEEIARKGLENAHTVDFSKQYENSMKILQKAKINLPSDDDLEKYASRAGFDYVDDIEQKYPGHRWNDHDVEFAYRDGIIAGAEWQKEQMGEQARKELFKDDLTLADLVAFDVGCNLGRRLERQDMLKDAVEGTYAVTTVGHFAFFTDKPIKDLCFGDQVKIIIVPIKED